MRAVLRYVAFIAFGFIASLICEVGSTFAQSGMDTLTEAANSSDGGEPGRLTPYRWKMEELHKDIETIPLPYWLPLVKELPPQVPLPRAIFYCHIPHKLKDDFRKKRAGRAYRIVPNEEAIERCPPLLFLPRFGWLITTDYIIYKYPAYVVELSRMLYVTKHRKQDKSRAKAVAKELVDLQIREHNRIMKNAVEFTDKGTEKLWKYAGIEGNPAPERDKLEENLDKVKELLEKDLKPLIEGGKLKEEPAMAIFQRINTMIPRFFPVPGIHDNVESGGNDYKKQSHLPHFTPIKFASFSPYEYTQSYLSEESGGMKDMQKNMQAGFLALIDRMDFPKDFNQRGLDKIIKEGGKAFPTGAVRGAWDGRTADNTFKDKEVEVKVPEEIVKLMDPNLVKGEGGEYSPQRIDTDLKFKDEKVVGIRPYTIEDSDKLPNVQGGDSGCPAGPKNEEDAALGSGNMGVPGLPTGPYPSNRLLTGIAEGLRLFSSPKAGPEITGSYRMGMGFSASRYWVLNPWPNPRRPRNRFLNDDKEAKRPSLIPALDGLMPNFTSSNEALMKTNDREKALKQDMLKMQMGMSDNPFVYYDRIKASAQDWEKFNRFDRAKQLEDKKGSEFSKGDLQKIREEERLQELVSLVAFKTYAGCVGFPGYGMIDWYGGEGQIYEVNMMDWNTLMQHAGSIVVAR